MKRFHGWEPATSFTYDDGGRLAGSVVEPEWDEHEQTVMLGLAAYRASLCPMCGMPVEVCTAIENDGRFAVDGPLRCHKSTALAVASSKLSADHPHKEALMFGAHLKPPS